MGRANRIDHEMKVQNRLRAEPAMQAAARAVGAELLPVLPEEVYDCNLPNWPLPPGSDCIAYNPTYSPLAKLLDARGAVHQAVPIQVEDWYYARLARRGDDLFLLVPKVTHHEVDRRKQCECDGMPRIGPPERPRVVFIVEGTPRATLWKVEVPVTEDYVGVECKLYLM
jgi:hypothetical protein